MKGVSAIERDLSCGLNRNRHVTRSWNTTNNFSRSTSTSTHSSTRSAKTRSSSGRPSASSFELWQDNKLCSSYYIRFWSSVVKAGDSETFKAKVLAASKRQSAAMMQNTPFSFLMRERS